MSELTLTLLRLGLLVALWLFVFGVLSTLRRDLLSGTRTVRSSLVRPAARAPRQPLLQHRRMRGTHLVITRPDGSTQNLELGEDVVTIGHAEDNTVVLRDEYTSMHHARITKRDRTWVIEDCGSTNGTWVDRKRISAPTPLTQGLRARVGKTEIAIRT